MESKQTRRPFKVHLVSSTDSPEFTNLTRALTRSSLVSLDAEWKPTTRSDRRNPPSFPAVALLQIACADSEESSDSVVFLLDLLSIPLDSISESLRDALVSPDILKLGFRFKQDLVYLSSTFSCHGCDNGFDKVEPYMDIASVYNYVQHNQYGKRISKNIKSLTTICSEVLGISLSKELQCSDWSHRPLSDAQLEYAAMDAHCLLEIFDVFRAKVIKEWNSDTESKEVVKMDNLCDETQRMNLREGLGGDGETTRSDISERGNLEQARAFPMEESLLKVVREFGEKLYLEESDKKPKFSKRKGKGRSSAGLMIRRENEFEIFSEDWKSISPPWDSLNGGNGFPRFLCDVMVEGLAKHLRCVGIDAAIPCTKKPDPRELINQAHRENRVLLTRDAKLLSYQYAIKNQIYRVKSLLKNEQLLEVIEVFDLKISEDQLMSRCTKCNGRFVQRPLSTEEAVEAAKGFQRIPSCLFNKNLEFWQCMDCNQLYWEGTQYKNAVQKFIDVCKLN